ncbi:MAG: hypothetical protein IPN26_08655 [Bacteroidetes bacterium]|nr:hypothetical protein [Bacteroidota bacterium]
MGWDQTKISLIAGLHTQDVMWNMMLAKDRASLRKSAAELRFNADLFLSDIQGVGDEYIRQAESRIDQWRANNAQKQHHNDVKTSALNAAKSKNVTLPEGLSTADYEGPVEIEPQSDDDNSLYTTPYGEPTVSVEEWAKHYEGMTWNEITIDNKLGDGDGYQRYFFGIIKLRLGPPNDAFQGHWRYVKLNNGMILDMRHVLVVGMQTNFGCKTGVALGFLGEFIQLIYDKKSSMSRQDYVSNHFGEEFLNYLEKIRTTIIQNIQLENMVTVGRQIYHGFFIVS